jgi:uncharacterized protein with PQ loop repeat
MIEEVLKHSLSVIGTALQISRAVPASWQVIRTRQVDPGDGLAISLLMISGIWWTVYAIEIGNMPTLISSVVGLAPVVATLGILHESGNLRRSNLLLVVVGVVAVPIAIVSSGTAAAVAAATGAAIGVPTAIDVLRRPDSTGDVSIGTWVLVTVNATVWIVYGILIEHPILGAAGLIQLPCCLVIIVRWLRARGT